MTALNEAYDEVLTREIELLPWARGRARAERCTAQDRRVSIRLVATRGLPRRAASVELTLDDWRPNEELFAMVREALVLGLAKLGITPMVRRARWVRRRWRPFLTLARTS